MNRDIIFNFYMQQESTGNFLVIDAQLDEVLDGRFVFRKQSIYNRYHIIAIGEYTGIRESQGGCNRIFEHQIVKRTSMTPNGIDFIGEVIFMEGSFWLYNPNSEKKFVPLFTEVDTLEIIGNIFENSDMLGGE